MWYQKDPLAKEAEKRMKAICLQLERQGWLSSFDTICCQKCCWVEARDFKSICVVTQESRAYNYDHVFSVHWKGRIEDLEPIFHQSGFMIIPVDEYGDEKGLRLGTFQALLGN